MDTSGPTVAERLPPHILIQVFFELVGSQDLDDGLSSSSTLVPSEPMHGGRLIGWDSNEIMKDLALVCRAWQDSAQFVLYRSVAILSAVTGELFLRTSNQSPSLVMRTTSLVIGLGKHREDTEAGEAHLEESIKVVEVLQACPNLRHLLIRPLHLSVRLPLIDVLRRVDLTSFALLGRLDGMQWSEGLLQPYDLPVLLKPSLRRIELDFDCGPAPITSPAFPPLPPDSLNLVALRLHVDVSPDFLLSLLAATASTLQHLDIYLETPLRHDQLLRSLLPSAQTLRSLSLIINPTLDTFVNHGLPSPRLIDALLPHLSKLELVRISDSDISVASISRLPPSLRYICIQNLRVVQALSPIEEVGEAIGRIQRGTLRVLCIHDTVADWEEQDILNLRGACESRDIIFQLSDTLECDLIYHIAALSIHTISSTLLQSS